jgi:hypothetical protein
MSHENTRTGLPRVQKRTEHRCRVTKIATFELETHKIRNSPIINRTVPDAVQLMCIISN